MAKPSLRGTKPAKELDSTATQELFVRAHGYNWDTGMRGLQRILDHEACDRATALLIYWMGRPGFYNEYKTDADAPGFARKELALVRLIEQRITVDRYPNVLAFDPRKSSITAEMVPAKPGRIPRAMYRACRGRVRAEDVLDRSGNEERLIIACREGSMRDVIACCELGLDLDKAIDGDRPVGAAAEHGHLAIVRYLLARGADPTLPSEGWSGTALHQASQALHTNIVKLLLAHGVDIDIRDAAGRTALHDIASWSAEGWRRPGVQQHVALLLARGADLHAKDKGRDTPLDLAKASRNKAAVKLLQAAMR